MRRIRAHAFGVIQQKEKMDMNDKDIDFYIRLSKKVRMAPYIWTALGLLLVANTYFQFADFIDQGMSSLGFLFSLMLVGESYFKDSESAKCQKIINDFVNSNPELIQKINQRRNA